MRARLPEKTFHLEISLSLATRSHRWSFIVDVHVHISPAINKVDPFSGGDVGDYTEEGGVRGVKVHCVFQRSGGAVYTTGSQ